MRPSAVAVGCSKVVVWPGLGAGVGEVVLRLWTDCAAASVAWAGFASAGWTFGACSGVAGSLRASAEAVAGLAEAAVVGQVEEQEKPALDDSR
jgi:hypothetical protein